MWKYKVESDLNQLRLNELGADGWELIAVVNVSSEFATLKFFFKRKVANAG